MNTKDTKSMKDGNNSKTWKKKTAGRPQNRRLKSGVKTGQEAGQKGTKIVEADWADGHIGDGHGGCSPVGDSPGHCLDLPAEYLLTESWQSAGNLHFGPSPYTQRARWLHNPSIC